MALAGLVGTTLFAVWGVGGLWMGDRAFEATTPILYMPTVGGGFVAAITCAAFGMKELGLLYFGAGLLSWLTLESVVIHRLILQTLPVPLRASLGLHLAPPAVACVAYLAVTDGPPDRLAQILFGYALLHALVMVRLVPWLRQQPFSPAAWAYNVRRLGPSARRVAPDGTRAGRAERVSRRPAVHRGQPNHRLDRAQDIEPAAARQALACPSFLTTRMYTLDVDSHARTGEAPLSSALARPACRDAHAGLPYHGLLG